MAKKQSKPPAPLQQLAAGNPLDLVAMLLWQQRIQNPEMTVRITEDDVKAFGDCMAYLKVEPEVKVVRRKGWIAVTLVEKGTEIVDDKGNVTSPGNAIKPIENNERTFEQAERAERLRRLKDGAQALVNQLRSDEASNNFSSSTILEAAETIEALIR